MDEIKIPKLLKDDKEFNKYEVGRFGIAIPLAERNSKEIFELRDKVGKYKETIEKLLNITLKNDKVISKLDLKARDLSDVGLENVRYINQLKSKIGMQQYQLQNLREIIDNNNKLNKKLKKKIKKLKAK